MFNFLTKTYKDLAQTCLQLPLRHCMPFSIVQLQGKHCLKPHCRNGVVDTSGPMLLAYQARHAYKILSRDNHKDLFIKKMNQNSITFTPVLVQIFMNKSLHGLIPHSAGRNRVKWTNC